MFTLLFSKMKLKTTLPDNFEKMSVVARKSHLEIETSAMGTEIDFENS